MKKKLAALLLCTAMICSMAACGEATDGEKETGGNENESEEGKEGEQEEIVEIIWQYPSSGNIGVGFQDMEDALNELMEKDIGVHVTFEPVNLGECQQEAMLMVTGNEQLDLCMSAFTSIEPLVTGNMILPLDDLIKEYGQGILDLGTNMTYGYYGSTLYAVPPVTLDTSGYVFFAKTELLDKYDIAIDDSKIYSFDELEDIFEVIKEGEGDNFYCFPIDDTFSSAINLTYDEIGGSKGAGVLMLNRDFKELTLHNLYETDEYMEYAKRMYQWAQKGFISPDAAVTTETTDTLVSTDNYLGTFYFADPLANLEYGNTVGAELTSIRIMEPYVKNGGGVSCVWSIPITSKHPEKAMEALNYIYTNDEANWLIQYGLEGVSYEIVEQTDEGTQIRMLSEDVNSLPYYNPYGLWGNQLHYPSIYPAPVEKQKLRIEMNEGIPEERKSGALGYNFISTDVASELAAVNTVIAQYERAINAGALNPEEAIPEFVKSLEDAGIDKFIAENQRQLDEWAASKE